MAHIKAIPSSRKMVKDAMLHSPGDSEASSSTSSALRKRKREESGDPRSGMTSPASFRTDTPTLGDEAKKFKFEAANALIQAIPTETLEEDRRKLKTGYKLFQLANRESARTELPKDLEEHPDRALEKLLTKKWDTLPATERKYYQEQANKLCKGEEEEEPKPPPPKKSKRTVSQTAASDAPETEEDEAFNDAASTASAASTVKSAKSSASAKSEDKKTLLTDVIGVFRKEHCCAVCEEVKSLKNPGDVILKCKGVCCRAFHSKCVPGGEVVNLKKALDKSEAWKCRDCVLGVHACLLCKQTGEGVQRCSVTNCGRFYHPACLRDSGLWPQAQFTEKQLTCPAHLCHTCASENPKDPFMKYSSKLVRCVRCPTAYHSGDHCVAAGTVQITATQIICPKHFVPPTGSKNKGGAVSHLNVTWCFLCSKGGTLMCCERCPAAFHMECLKLEKPPEGQVGNHYQIHPFLFC